ncbi:MAG: AraC family transcriptional regulator [Acidobacteria bacterium]|nr:MAG: AraC family transcriptional regulator [Acidobacteriota bacterium]
MERQTIPISKVRTILGFIDLMIEIGAPVETWLELHRLPVNIHEDPNAFVPTKNFWDFLAFAIRKEDIKNLGFRLGQDRTYEMLGQQALSRMATAPTLLACIQEFARLMNCDYTAMKVWLTDAGDETVHLHTDKIFPAGSPGFFQTEWLALIGMVQVVRLFAGRRWQPNEVALQSKDELLPLACGFYPDVRFRIGQRGSYIAISKKLLSLGPHAEMIEVMGGLDPDPDQSSPRDPPVDFPESLNLLLKSYLRDGYPSVDLAAELAGISTRTLQRRLSERGLSYSRLVDRTRFELASKLLKSSDASSLEIAVETGYKDPSNFARAFRRLAGCSPREYRRRHAEGLR